MSTSTSTPHLSRCLIYKTILWSPADVGSQQDVEVNVRPCYPELEGSRAPTTAARTEAHQMLLNLCTYRQEHTARTHNMDRETRTCSLLDQAVESLGMNSSCVVQPTFHMQAERQRHAPKASL